MRSYTPDDLLDLGACSYGVDRLREVFASRGWTSIRPTSRNLRRLQGEGVDVSWAVAQGLVSREVACEDPYWAYRYARYVDECPRPDTRSAACSDSEWAYRYALHVDECPHPDTRSAACSDSEWACRYALYVDRGPHPDTRSAACEDPYWAYRYACDVDRGPHPDTWAAVRGSDREDWYRHHVGAAVILDPPGG